MSKKPTPMLPPRQKRLVRESFASVADYSTSLTKLFYGRLFELAPGVRGLFKVSLEEQSKKLLEMLATIVNALDHPEDLRPRLAELGRKHVTYGVKPEHYELVRKALLWALAQALEGEFDPETKDAWDQLLRAVATAMLEEQKTVV
jgi:hemoglobin-like flavoprotein